MIVRKPARREWTDYNYFRTFFHASLLLCSLRLLLLVVDYLLLCSLLLLVVDCCVFTIKFGKCNQTHQLGTRSTVHV